MKLKVKRKNRMYTITKIFNLINIDCCACGITFSIPDYLYKILKETKRDFNCPLGHQQAFTISESERLRKELEVEKSKLNYRERLISKMSGKIKKYEKRLKLLKK